MDGENDSKKPFAIRTTKKARRLLFGAISIILLFYILLNYFFGLDYYKIVVEGVGINYYSAQFLYCTGKVYSGGNWGGECSCTEMNRYTFLRSRGILRGLIAGKNPNSTFLDDILLEHDYWNPECDTPQIHRRGNCCVQYCNICQEQIIDSWKNAYTSFQNKDIETAQIYLQRADDFLESNEDCFDCRCVCHYYSH